MQFTGGGLNRAAQFRASNDDLRRLWAQENAQTYLLWRGQVLARFAIDADVNDDLAPPALGLAALAVTHPLVQDLIAASQSGGSDDATGAALPDNVIFIGLDDGCPVFALDGSAWTPETLSQSLGAFVDPSRQHHPLAPDNTAFVELRGIMASLTPIEGEIIATARALTMWHKSHAFCAACGQASRVAMAGWQRNCPACNTPHFPRTDPVVIMAVTDGDRLLLGRSPAWPEGMYSVLAGFIEPGETIEAAVRREVFEEAGIKVGDVQLVTSQPWPFPASLMIGCRGQAVSDVITIDADELEDALWVTRDDLARILAGHHPAITRPRQGTIARELMQLWLSQA